MPRINSDVASITVGGVAGFRPSCSTKTLEPTTSVSSVNSDRTSKTTYTTKSGYSLSTSFSDNIKWSRKKSLKPSSSVSSNLSGLHATRTNVDVKKNSRRSLPKMDEEDSPHDGVNAGLNSGSNPPTSESSSQRSMLERKSSPIIITNSTSPVPAVDEKKSKFSEGFNSFFKSLRSRKAPPESLDLSEASNFGNSHHEYPKSAFTPYNSHFNDIPTNNYLYPVFGLPLEQAMKLNVAFESTDILAKVDSIERVICDIEYQKFIPLILFKCVKFITRYGLDEEGLYRVSGSSADVQRLKHRFLTGKFPFPFFFFFLSSLQIGLHCIALLNLLQCTFQNCICVQPTLLGSGVSPGIYIKLTTCFRRTNIRN
jgi:hypothetical protein